MTELSFGSAFCFDAHTAISTEWNMRGAEASFNRGDFITATQLSLRAVQPISIGEILCDEILSSIPILAQISGIFSIMTAVLFLNGPDTGGRHSFGQGLIVRGILEILNLGLILLITDIAISIITSYARILDTGSDFTLTINI